MTVGIPCTLVPYNIEKFKIISVSFAAKHKYTLPAIGMPTYLCKSIEIDDTTFKVVEVLN